MEMSALEFYRGVGSVLFIAGGALVISDAPLIEF